MFGRKKKTSDWELELLSDDVLASLPLHELQRINNKRWARANKPLQKQTEDELKRRDPRTNWQCLRCHRAEFHERDVRVSGGFVESFLNWERHKYHVIVCNYCGKAEFYPSLMPASEQTLGLLGG